MSDHGTASHAQMERLLDSVHPDGHTRHNDPPTVESTVILRIRRLIRKSTRRWALRRTTKCTTDPPSGGPRCGRSCEPEWPTIKTARDVPPGRGVGREVPYPSRRKIDSTRRSPFRSTSSASGWRPARTCSTACPEEPTETHRTASRPRTSSRRWCVRSLR